MITRRRLAEVEKQARGCRVAVVGDLILDEFLAGSVERISPEAPVPVLTYGSDRFVLGGAGNAARTLAALGARADLVGLIGNDAAGDTIVAEAASAGVDTSGIVVAATRSTALKTRVIAGTQQIVRIDREASGAVPAAVRRLLEQEALSAAARADAVLVSDYAKGALTERIARRLVQDCESHGIPCVVDSKALHSAYRGATVLTPNLGELARMARTHTLSDKDVKRAAGVVLRRHSPDALLVTRSEAGMSLFALDRESVDIPALSTEVRDVTGAGDTVAAVVALGLAIGLDLEEAAVLATLAAAVVVRKVGTAAPNWAEMATLAED